MMQRICTFDLSLYEGGRRSKRSRVAQQEAVGRLWVFFNTKCPGSFDPFYIVIYKIGHYFLEHTVCIWYFEYDALIFFIYVFDLQKN